MSAYARELGKPLVVQTMYWRSEAADALREAETPVYRDLEGALTAIAALVRAGVSRPRGVPDLPAATHDPLTGAGYWESRAALEAAGVPFAAARPAGRPEEALTAAEELGFPVVLKALAASHKSDSGGVVVGIPDRAALEEQLSRMATFTTEYSVERTAPVAMGVELIVGVRRDPRFGPVTLVGMGGVYAELLGDVAVALAPVTEQKAEELIRSLRGAPLLTGARGRPPVDVPAAAVATAALSRFAAEHPEVDEVEVNPLLVLPEGALGLDARLVLADDEGRNAA
jgi:acyl-CoA synthetase (NDP forming)